MTSVKSVMMCAIRYQKIWDPATDSSVALVEASVTEKPRTGFESGLLVSASCVALILLGLGFLIRQAKSSWDGFWGFHIFNLLRSLWAIGTLKNSIGNLISLNLLHLILPLLIWTIKERASCWKPVSKYQMNDGNTSIGSRQVWASEVSKVNSSNSL